MTTTTTMTLLIVLLPLLLLLPRPLLLPLLPTTTTQIIIIIIQLSFFVGRRWSRDINPTNNHHKHGKEVRNLGSDRVFVGTSNDLSVWNQIMDRVLFFLVVCAVWSINRLHQLSFTVFPRL